MARGILACGRFAAALLALVVLPSFGFSDVAPEQGCSIKRSGDVPSAVELDIPSFQQRVKAGLFYKALLSDFGKPTTCSLEVQDTSLQLTYAFHDRAQLTVGSDRSIEFNEQRLQVRRMETKKAMELLKKAEREMYQPNGCGIVWDHPSEESFDAPTGSRETVYRGTSCNCQARLTSQSKYAVSLVLQSAC